LSRANPHLERDRKPQVELDPQQTYYFRVLGDPQWRTKLKSFGYTQLFTAVVAIVSSIVILASTCGASDNRGSSSKRGRDQQPKDNDKKRKDKNKKESDSSDEGLPYAHIANGVWTVVLISYGSLLALDLSLAYSLWTVLKQEAFNQNVLPLVEIGSAAIVPFMLYLGMAILGHRARREQRELVGDKQSPRFSHPLSESQYQSAQNVLLRTPVGDDHGLSTVARSQEASASDEINNGEASPEDANQDLDRLLRTVEKLREITRE